MTGDLCGILELPEFGHRRDAGDEGEERRDDCGVLALGAE